MFFDRDHVDRLGRPFSQPLMWVPYKGDTKDIAGMRRHLMAHGLQAEEAKAHAEEVVLAQVRCALPTACPVLLNTRFIAGRGGRCALIRRTQCWRLAVETRMPVPGRTA